MEEVEVRETGVLSLLEGSVELLGRYGDAQGREVRKNFVTPTRRRLGGLLRFHRRLPRVGVNAGNRWSDVGRSLLAADWDRAFPDAGRRVRRVRVSVWRRRRGYAGSPPGRRRRSGRHAPGLGAHRRVDIGPPRPRVAGLAVCPGSAWRAGRRGTARPSARVR